MKIVAAKCPNCGAEIEVDKNSDSTRCEYCNSKIIVEDALENYKLNKVEVSNMPKYENYIILGDRYYNDKNYGEACEYYGKALELDPNNEYVILKRGFSKSLSSGFKDFDVKSATTALKNISDSLKRDNSKKKYNLAIIDCSEIIKDGETRLLNYYRERGINRGEIEYFNSKLQDCLNCYEYLYSITEEDEIKKLLLTNIIKEIDNILMAKVYLTGQFIQSGVPAKAFYHMNNTNASIFRTARLKYVRQLNEIKNPQIKVQHVNKQNSSTKYISEFKKMSTGQKISFVTGIFFIMCAVTTLLIGKILAYPFLVLTGIVFLPQIKDGLVKKFEKKIRDFGLLVNVLRGILVFISIIVFVLILIS